ncbi:MAG: arginine N-succinyltransferase, partial [Planctomycetota bacterium]|nr:arginine N-succinyltransferase [Planctomycetota bacterium]
MFFIRQAQPADLGTLLKMARMVYFINLPPDKDVIAGKIRMSQASFAAARGASIEENGRAPMASLSKGAAGDSPSFMFVLEDSTTGNPIGTSAVIAEMGRPGNPNLWFQLRKREFFSQDLQQGQTHVTAQLVLEENGPTEIGGLILAPSYRGHKQRLGKQLSLIRFHYIGLHREEFKDRLLAEMMAPITPDGRNTLWEFLGRRFINLDYTEADRFCAHSREFMTSLLPREEIYLTLLPPEARALIGRVGPDTVPARLMLERLGFEYRDRIDPFDGGPHLEAKTDEVSIVAQTRKSEFAGVCQAAQAKRMGFVSCEGGSGNAEFRALQTAYGEKDDGSVLLPRSAVKTLGVDEGMIVGVTPLDGKGG